MRHGGRLYEVNRISGFDKYEKWVCETKPLPRSAWEGIQPAWFYTEDGFNPATDVTLKPAGGDKVTVNFALGGSQAFGWAFPAEWDK